MELGKAASWLQIGANLGILIGLVLVGVQISQSNAIAGAQIFHANIESTINREIALFGESPNESMHRVLFKPESATPEDYFVADRVYNTVQKQLVRAIMFEDAGLYGVGVATPEGFVRNNFRLFACPYGLATIDQAIAFIPKDSPLYAYPRLMRDLAAETMAGQPIHDRLSRVNNLIEELSR